MKIRALIATLFLLFNDPVFAASPAGRSDSIASKEVKEAPSKHDPDLLVDMYVSSAVMILVHELLRPCNCGSPVGLRKRALMLFRNGVITSLLTKAFYYFSGPEDQEVPDLTSSSVDVLADAATMTGLHMIEKIPSSWSLLSPVAKTLAPFITFCTPPARRYVGGDKSQSVITPYIFRNALFGWGLMKLFHWGTLSAWNTAHKTARKALAAGREANPNATQSQPKGE